MIMSLNKKMLITAMVMIFCPMVILKVPVHGSDDAYISFLMRAEMRNEWQVELLQKVPEMDQSQKWALLWDPGTALERVSYALSLLRNDQGGHFHEDLSRVSGFIPDNSHLKGPGLPKQLIFIQAGLASLSLLCEIKTPEALATAGDIVRHLWQNREFKVFLEKVGVEKGDLLYATFSSSRGIFSVFQGEFT